MKDFSEYREVVVGKQLTGLFFTKQDGPYDYLPGISPAYYFSTVMELDHRIKIWFCETYLEVWQNEETLLELTNKNWDLPKHLVFKGQVIKEVTKDKEDKLTFHLENGITIRHTMDMAISFLFNAKREQPK